MIYRSDGAATIGLRTVLMAPLASQAELLGVLFVGHADDRVITPNADMPLAPLYSLAHQPA